MAVVKAAELLDFVDTPKRLVILDAAGQRFVKASPEERKAVWREQLMHLRIYKEIVNLIHRSPDKEIDRDLALETIVFRMPYENYEKVFDTLVRWGRFGDLLAYDEATQRLWLQQESVVKA
jgi:NitT/TauT family transport system ATP-binding protein